MRYNLRNSHRNVQTAPVLPYALTQKKCELRLFFQTIRSIGVNINSCHSSSSFIRTKIHTQNKRKKETLSCVDAGNATHRHRGTLLFIWQTSTIQHYQLPTNVNLFHHVVNEVTCMLDTANQSYDKYHKSRIISVLLISFSPIFLRFQIRTAHTGMYAAKKVQFIAGSH